MTQRINITNAKLSEVKKLLEDNEKGHIETRAGEVFLVVETYKEEEGVNSPSLYTNKIKVEE